MSIGKFPKKTMTLNLSPREMMTVENLAISKGTTKTGLVRAAIRFYQSMQEDINKGDGWRLESRIVDKDGMEISKIKYID